MENLCWRRDLIQMEDSKAPLLAGSSLADVKPWYPLTTKLFLDPGLSECPDVVKNIYDGDGLPYFSVPPVAEETPVDLYVNFNGASPCQETGPPGTHCPVWSYMWKNGFAPMGHPEWESSILNFVRYAFRPFAVKVTNTPPRNGWQRRGGFRLTLGKGGKPPPQGQIKLGVSGMVGAFYEFYQSKQADALGYPHDVLIYPGYHEGCFDTDYVEFSTGSDPGGIYPIAAHEPGHGLGLWHTTAPTIMGWDGVHKPSSWYKPEWTSFQWSPRQVAWILSWVGPSDWAVNVITAYHLHLMRPPDLPAFLAWNQQGTSLDKVLTGNFGISNDVIRSKIISTPEALSRRIDVARWSYHNLLGRSPSSFELDTCSHHTADDILNSAVNSAEFRTRGDLVTNLYRIILGRQPDDLGYKNAVQLIRQQGILPLMDIFLKSREFAYRSLN